MSPLRLSTAALRRLQRGIAPRPRRRPSARLPAMPDIEPIRAPDRYRSTTERRFAALLDRWRDQGDLVGWWYEPFRGLYLAPRTTYTPDFLTTSKAGHVALYEVKGKFIRPKDRQKLKQAAAMYWCFPFFLAQEIDGEWTIERIPID